MITPFAGEEVDEARMRDLLTRQQRAGTAAVVLAGTTGESATLRSREFERLIALGVGEASGKMRVIAGIGGNDTAACLNKALFAQSAGADAVLMTPPYYNKTTQAGVIRHFCQVADRLQIPLILYNVPGRTAIGIDRDTYKALSRHPNINGVKEASGDISLAAFLASECADGLNLWSGNDDLTVPMMALGAKGVISVVSNLVPEAVAALCKACLEEDYAAAREHCRRYAELYRLLFVETNPIPIKAAMELCGLDSGQLRLPLVELTAPNREMLRACMRHLGLPLR